MLLLDKLLPSQFKYCMVHVPQLPGKSKHACVQYMRDPVSNFRLFFGGGLRLLLRKSFWYACHV